MGGGGGGVEQAGEGGVGGQDGGLPTSPENVFKEVKESLARENLMFYLQVGRKVVGQAEAKMVEEELRFGQPADHQGQCCHHHQKQWY